MVPSWTVAGRPGPAHLRLLTDVVRGATIPHPRPTARVFCGAGTVEPVADAGGRLSAP